MNDRDRQTEGERERERERDREKEIYTDIHTDRQWERETERQRDREIERDREREREKKKTMIGRYNIYIFKNKDINVDCQNIQRNIKKSGLWIYKLLCFVWLL